MNSWVSLFIGLLAVIALDGAGLVRSSNRSESVPYLGLSSRTWP